MQEFKRKVVGAQVPESQDPMTQPNERNQDLYRIEWLNPYVFAGVGAMKAVARSAIEDIIDFGIGNPGNPARLHGP